MNMEPPRYGDETAGMPAYDQPLLYLGFFHPSYGHFLLEVISYWWALLTEYGRYDRYLIHVHDASVLQMAHVQACLAALNIKPEQIVHFDRPTRLRHVVVPDPSVQLNSHIHTQYRTLMEKIAVGLGAREYKQTDQPLYVSRRKLDFGKDRYIGEDKIEGFLAERGARVIHPQEMPFREQVKVFNEHRRILGMIGSGMHNIVLALQPKELTYFTTHLINDNFFIVDSCFEADSTYVKACPAIDRYRVLVGDLVKGITGRRKRADGFLTAHELDTPRVIEWLTAAGRVA
jgi:capsular polysaccharide biosynthesis protein